MDIEFFVGDVVAGLEDFNATCVEKRRGFEELAAAVIAVGVIVIEKENGAGAGGMSQVLGKTLVMVSTLWPPSMLARMGRLLVLKRVQMGCWLYRGRAALLLLLISTADFSNSGNLPWPELD